MPPDLFEIAEQVEEEERYYWPIEEATCGTCKQLLKLEEAEYCEDCWPVALVETAHEQGEEEWLQQL